MSDGSSTAVRSRADARRWLERIQFGASVFVVCSMLGGRAMAAAPPDPQAPPTPAASDTPERGYVRDAGGMWREVDCQANLCIRLGQDAMERLHSLGAGVVFFTSKAQPLRALTDLRVTGVEVGVWGAELLGGVLELLSAAQIQVGAGGQGLGRIVGDDAFATLFTANPQLRLFVTHSYPDEREANIERTGGGQRLYLVSHQQDPSRVVTAPPNASDATGTTAPTADTSPSPAAAPQDGSEYEAFRKGLHVGEGERRQSDEEIEKEQERQYESALASARRAARTPRVLLAAGVGGVLWPSPGGPVQESAYRFEIGAAYQQHFHDYVGFQGLLTVGIAGVQRPNTTRDQERTLLTGLVDVSLEPSLIIGPFWRVRFGVGPWLSVGGYTDSEVETTTSTMTGEVMDTSFFPDAQAPGNAVLGVGPNFSVGVYLGQSRRMDIGLKVQPGVRIASDTEGVMRLAAYFGFLLP